jgi:hypothetical protein
LFHFKTTVTPPLPFFIGFACLSWP